MFYLTYTRRLFDGTKHLMRFKTLSLEANDEGVLAEDKKNTNAHCHKQFIRFKQHQMQCSKHKLMFGIFENVRVCILFFLLKLLFNHSDIWIEAERETKKTPSETQRIHYKFCHQSVFRCFFKHRSFWKCHSACKMRSNLICWLPHTHIEHVQIEPSSFIDKQYRNTRY